MCVHTCGLCVCVCVLEEREGRIKESMQTKLWETTSPSDMPSFVQTRRICLASSQANLKVARVRENRESRRTEGEVYAGVKKKARTVLIQCCVCGACVFVCLHATFLSFSPPLSLKLSFCFSVSVSLLLLPHSSISLHSSICHLFSLLACPLHSLTLSFSYCVNISAETCIQEH